MTTKAPLAGIDDVSKSFPGVVAVREATLEIRSGEVHCLVGENGAGKSTVVKMLAGVYQPDAGTVRIGSKATRFRSPNQALQAGISTIFQEFMLVPEMTVAENIFLGRNPVRIPGVLARKEREARALGIFQDIGVRDINPGARVKDLGVAYQQIVEIAKALSLDGERILIMDEPTAALTPNEIDRLFTVIRELRNRGVGILYITHRLEELDVIGDVVTVMRDGAVVMSSVPMFTVGRRELIEAMVGRTITDLFPKRAVSIGDVVLEVQHVSVPSKVADASLTVRCGEVVGLFGLIGSGRTELVRALVGADRLVGGRVLLHGNLVRFRSPGRALAAGVGFAPEDRKRQGIVPLMTVASNIGLASMQRLSRGTGFLTDRTINEFGQTYIDKFHIRTRSPRQAINNLSGGNQQKCILARVLATQPNVVILDEPTRGVDVGARTEVYTLINDLCAQGKGVLMITSDLSEALGMSDRILIMRHGRIVGELGRAEATEPEIMELAFGSELAVGSS